MMDLAHIDLLSLQTASMKQDKTIQALCAALNLQFQQLSDEVKACLIYSRVDDLDGTALDELAWQMHIDWYDSKADVIVKRQLIKSALKVHRYRGTKYAVEEVLKTYFTEAEIKEWFEYGGDPYTFRVSVRSGVIDTELAAQFTMAVNVVKNVRSHMDLVIVFNTYQELTAFTHDQLGAHTYIELREGDFSA
jgi:phage tail P2-like protein